MYKSKKSIPNKFPKKLRSHIIFVGFCYGRHICSERRDAICRNANGDLFERSEILSLLHLFILRSQVLHPLSQFGILREVTWYIAVTVLHFELLK